MSIDLTDERNSPCGVGIFVLMPISRLLLESKFDIDGYQFLPAGTVDVDALNIADLPSLDDLTDENGARTAKADELRRLCTSLVGEDLKDVFDSNAAVWFTTTKATARKNHKEDIDLIAVLSQDAERAVDQVRFDYCRFDLPDTLPGTVGTWMGSETFCLAILYDPDTKSSELIAGEALLHSVVSKGLGLELSDCQCGGVESLPTRADGEVGGIAQHGLRLTSDVMNSNTNTSKYLRAMTLLEFLASPFEFQTFKKTKKDIAIHVAKTHEEYLSLLERFRRLSDLKDESSDTQLGYRTLMVHNGKFMEEIIPNSRERASIFLELQRYSGMVIDDLIERKHQPWSGIVEYRKDKRARLLSQAKSAS